MSKIYKHEKTEFQKSFCEDRNTVLKIIEALFPDTDFDWQKERGKLNVYAHSTYTWVNVQDESGFIDFAIDNHECGLTGEITKEDVKNASFTFKTIIFGSRFNHSISDVRKKRVAGILKDAGYKKPSIEEFWREYHAV